MILGMDWIDMVVTFILHTRPHSLSFMSNGGMITLYGVAEDSNISIVDTEASRRMLKCGTYEVVSELALIQEEEDNEKQRKINPGINK